MLRLFGRVATGAAAAILLVVVVAGTYVGLGWRAEARLDGELAGLPLDAPVRVLRDERGIPHIRAASLRDLMVAQGYVEGADRLFQMDLIRHHVYGRIAEWFGKAALAHDRQAREFDVAGIIEREYAALSPDDRAMVDAFSQGVNAAMRGEPLPVEYRLLMLSPEPWKPQDALAAGFATVIDLTDPWSDVIERERVYRRFGAAGLAGLYPITDPRYDAPTTGAPPAPVAPLPRLPARGRLYASAAIPETSEGKGSNNWAAGGARTRSGRALLANDPHLRIGIPGVWYLIDLQAPGYHAAGATLAGTPGVILGHSEHLAWGATNGTVVSESIYVARKPVRVRNERFGVRFGGTVEHAYEEDAHGFIVPDALEPERRYAVDWEPARTAISPLAAFARLARAASVEDGMRALRSYPGPPQNFVLADTSGRAAFVLAGHIPNDPFWGLRAHAPSDASFQPIAAEELPQVAPSRSAVVFTANDRVYGRGYPFRLSPGFAPPYRAMRIKQRLAAQKVYDVDVFAAIQRDTLSLPERELAAAAVSAASRRHATNDPAVATGVAELGRWDGRFDPDSRGASLAFALRGAVLQRFAAGFFPPREAAAFASSASGELVTVLRALREKVRGYVQNDDYNAFLIAALREAGAVRPWKDAGAVRPWKDAGAVRIPHPLAALGLHWFDGAELPGDGDGYAVHVQKSNHTQSFRAVWDVGNWDGGGIVIPSGESGRPGSSHYTDLSATWVAQKLVPLPYSAAAVEAAARHRLELRP